MIKVCSLFSGSSGNCIYISYNDTALLIDAGVSGRRIEKALSDIGESFDKIAGIFITHEHSDHINGAGYYQEDISSLFMLMPLHGRL